MAAGRRVVLSSRAMGPETAINHRRNDEIEVLRAFAVLFVIVEHINTLLYWRHETFDLYVNLYGGVDLFFCISGFVIASAFGSEISEAVATPKLYWRTVVAFYIRRAYRIIPLSWTVFFLTLAVLVTFQGFTLELLLRSLGDFLAIIFNVQNIHYGSCALTDTVYCGQFGIYWSLSLEEQFYLVFPLLFLLPRKVMICGLVAAVALFAFLPRTTVVWMTRIDAIALGVLLAFVRSSTAYQAFTPNILSHPAVRGPVLTILLCGLAVIPTGIVSFFPTMVSLISLILVFIASYDRGFLMAPGYIRSCLVWTGERSFAIYLLHNAVFWMIVGIHKTFFPPAEPRYRTTVFFIVAAIFLLAILTDLSFRYLETPLRRRGKRVAANFLSEEQPVAGVESTLAHAAE
jgi:peptidoglycan/LPS O-acetylase OafA/YrhL